MSAELLVTIDGAPVPKGRPRMVINPKTKKPFVITPRRTRVYEGFVRLTSLAAVRRIGWPFATDAPCLVKLVAYLPDLRRRDLDNIAKAILDACNGVVWADDSQVQLLSVQRELDRKRPRVEMRVRADVCTGAR